MSKRSGVVDGYVERERACATTLLVQLVGDDPADIEYRLPGVLFKLRQCMGVGVSQESRNAVRTEDIIAAVTSPLGPMIDPDGVPVR